MEETTFKSCINCAYSGTRDDSSKFCVICGKELSGIVCDLYNSVEAAMTEQTGSTNRNLFEENVKLCQTLNKIVKLINHDDDNVVYDKEYLINSQEEILNDLKNAIDSNEKLATNTQTENTFAPMKVSVAVPTADGDVALVEVNNFDELNNLKKNGVTKEMIENAEKLKHNDKPMFVGNMLHQIEVGRVYRHFKGKLYLVLDLATHSETGEQYVIYKALYGDCKIYVRPYLMFASGADREKYPNVEQTYRFELIED